MQTPAAPAKPRKARQRVRCKLTGAVFGASATFLVLLGATTVSDSPRQLPDFSDTPAPAETPDRSSLAAAETGGDVRTYTPTPRRVYETNLPFDLEVPA